MRSSPSSTARSIRSRVAIHRADSEVRLSWGDTSDNDKKRNPIRFDLAPGRYDVRISALDLADAEPIEIPGIQLGAEVEEKLAAEF